MPHCLCVKPHDDAIYPTDPKCSPVQCPNATESGAAAASVATSAFYGWIWSVQRNCQVAIALIATETAKSEISGTDMFGGPLPVSRRNIQGSRIMA